MAVSFVQGRQNNATTGATASVVLPSSPTAGNLLIGFIESGASATLPATPSGWTLDASTSTGGGSGRSAILCHRVVVAGDSATVSTSITSGRWQVQVHEYSGVDTTTPLQSGTPTAGTNASATVQATSAITPTASTDPLIVAFYAARSTTNAANWASLTIGGVAATDRTDATLNNTVSGTSYGPSFDRQITGASGTYAASATMPSANIIQWAIVALSPAAAAGSSDAPTLALVAGQPVAPPVAVSDSFTAWTPTDPPAAAPSAIPQTSVVVSSFVVPPVGSAIVSRTVPASVAAPSATPQTSVVVSSLAPPAPAGVAIVSRAPASVATPQTSIVVSSVIVPPVGSAIVSRTVPAPVASPPATPQTSVVVSSLAPPAPAPASIVSRTVPAAPAAPSATPQTSVVVSAAVPPVPTPAAIVARSLVPAATPQIPVIVSSFVVPPVGTAIVARTVPTPQAAPAATPQIPVIVSAAAPPAPVPAAIVSRTVPAPIAAPAATPPSPVVVSAVAPSVPTPTTIVARTVPAPVAAPPAVPVRPVVASSAIVPPVGTASVSRAPVEAATPQRTIVVSSVAVPPPGAVGTVAVARPVAVAPITRAARPLVVTSVKPAEVAFVHVGLARVDPSGFVDGSLKVYASSSDVVDHDVSSPAVVGAYASSAGITGGASSAGIGGQYGSESATTGKRSSSSDAL